LLVLLLVFGLFLYERENYNMLLVEKGYEKFASTELSKGLHFKRVDFLMDQNDEVFREISIQPGSVYEGAFYVKNNFAEKKDVMFVSFDVLDKKTKEKLEIEYDLEDDIFTLNPKEWRIVKYKISVPEDMPEGRFVGKVASRTMDSVKYNETTQLVVAVAVEFVFNISDDAEEISPSFLVDTELSPHKIAMSFVYSDLKKLFGLLCGVLAVVFLILGIKKKK
jgi:hypothetical protein